MTFTEALDYITDYGGVARLDTKDSYTQAYYSLKGKLLMDVLFRDEVISDEWNVYRK